MLLNVHNYGFKTLDYAFKDQSPENQHFMYQVDISFVDNKNNLFNAQ